ncbi:protein kinase [Acrocarpospora sp. B8E8]|uniref:serine/threonine-protein kinase n=1 Tax=Acrocarpospora sp. B8E8 TaxID=3153572 RepID=UPI00325F720F
MSHPLLGNRYRLTARIAAGGMGEVWRATDELLHREVAVKLLRAHVATDPAFRARFRSEARFTAGLTDAAIAQVFDYGEEDDTAYLVMELVHGEPLSAILARNGRLSAEVTLDVIAQAARGLNVAHRTGIIHRDIKPGNMLITDTGMVKITDFGIARALEAAPVTQTGTVLGTAQYVSPEQASGTTLTPATDIYSLGVVAYECLAGRPPFTAETQVAIALHHLNDPPPPLPDSVPPPLRGLVAAMLAKDPAMRPASARELGDRALVLRDSLAGGGSQALSTLTDPSGFPVTGGMTRVGSPPSGGPGTRTAPALPPKPPPRRRSPLLAFTLAGVALTLGLGTVAIMELRDPGRPANEGKPTQVIPVSQVPTPKKSPSPKASKPTPTVPSARPTPPPSATVSTTATPTPSPSPSPSPTPTPTATPSETLTPSETPPTPSITPSASTLSNEETP